jgi:hypothetical protein
MASTTSTYTSLYEQRVELVARSLMQHSELEEKTATDLAVHVLHAIDHVPEKLR